MTEPLANAPAEVDAAWHRLTAKQQAFALALPLAESQVAAAMAAGYSEKTAYKKARAMADNADVALVVSFIAGRHVSTAVEAMRETLDSVDRLAEELGCIAYCDPAGIFGADDTVLPVREWPEELRRNLAGVEVVEQYVGKGKSRKLVGYLKKFKFNNKVAGAEALAKLRQYGGFANIKEPPVAPTVNQHFYGGVVVLPAKESGRGRGATEGVLIEGEVVRQALPAPAEAEATS